MAMARWILRNLSSVTATGSVCGHLSNPLLVLPLHPPMAAETPSSPPRSAEPKLNNLVGAGYTAFEDSILMDFTNLNHHMG